MLLRVGERCYMWSVAPLSTIQYNIKCASCNILLQLGENILVAFASGWSLPFLLKQGHDQLVFLSCMFYLWLIITIQIVYVVRLSFVGSISVQHCGLQPSCFWASHSFHAICGPLKILLCRNIDPPDGHPEHNMCNAVVCDEGKSLVQLVNIQCASYERSVNVLDGLLPPSAYHVGEWGHRPSLCLGEGSSSGLSHKH